MDKFVKDFTDAVPGIDDIKRIPITNSLLEIICDITGMGFAVIAKVTDEKWVACNIRDQIGFGLPVGGELELTTTICNEVRQCNKPIVINDVELHEIYKDRPAPAMYGFKSYISVPIFLSDKSFFGTLCAIDPAPAKLDTPSIIGLFQRFAELISFHLSTMQELDVSNLKVEEENKNTETREQFIAILGHDLRNPVGAIANGAELLTMMTEQEDILRIVNIIRNSVHRTNILIKNMLDFASGRMGGGILMEIEKDIPIEKILKQIITETSTIWPEKIIDFQTDITTPVSADGNRLAQLFANLLRNAVTYGKLLTPVSVKAFTENNQFKLTLHNQGEPIEPGTMDRLFQPFYRGHSTKGQQGLGLGLYIASEIAKAHQGNIQVNSDEDGTIFTVSIPQPV